MSSELNSMPSDATPSAAGLNAFRPRIAFVTYNVEAIERALAFYVGVLGMQEQTRFPIGGGMNEVVLVFPDSKGSGLILIWQDSGVPLQTPPTDVGALRFAMIRDPDGYLIELVEFKRG